jgi:hypothetical protein
MAEYSRTSRARVILNLIEQFDDPENEKRHSLQGQPTGYRYMDRGEGNIVNQYGDGKRPAGYKSKAGHSA